VARDWMSGVRYIGGSQLQEDKAIQDLAGLVYKQVSEISHLTGQPKRRPQHAKPLAATKQARFLVSSGIAEDLRVGFLRPGSDYPCTIRFSNAGALIAADDEKDLRGMAVKVMVSEQVCHDLLMTNAEVHHAKTAIEAMWTSYLLYSPGLANKVRGILALIRKFGFTATKRIISTLSSQIGRPVASLATESFWSRSPYRIGSEAVRFVMRPMANAEGSATAAWDLAEELRNRLQSGAVRYRFEVQRYIDEQRTPLEDSTQPWLSPFEEVGYLVIDRDAELQDVATSDALTFNPWSVSSNDFEPLGNMNRARRHVYPSSVRARSA
jgi:hypothetical protein